MKRFKVLFVLICLLVASTNCITSESTPTSTPTPPTTAPPINQSPTPETPPIKGHLIVHFIDVGQGDAILIDLGETEVLIDGGDRSPGVVSYLRDYVDGPLEIMVVTHPHADHIGGLIELLGAVQDLDPPVRRDLGLEHVGEAA